MLRVSPKFYYRGFNFGYSAFLNSKFLGSSQGTNQYSAGGGVDMTNVTWSFDPSDLNSGENVVTVVFDQTGLEEDYNGQDTFKVRIIDNTFNICITSDTGDERRREGLEATSYLEQTTFLHGEFKEIWEVKTSPMW